MAPHTETYLFIQSFCPHPMEMHLESLCKARWQADRAAGAWSGLANSRLHIRSWSLQPTFDHTRWHLTHRAVKPRFVLPSGPLLGPHPGRCGRRPIFAFRSRPPAVAQPFAMPHIRPNFAHGHQMAQPWVFACALVVFCACDHFWRVFAVDKSRVYAAHTHRCGYCAMFGSYCWP